MKFINSFLIIVAALVILVIANGCSSTKEISDKTETTVKIQDHTITPDKIKDTTNEGHWSYPTLPDETKVTEKVKDVLNEIHNDSSFTNVSYTAVTKHGKITFFPHNDSLVTDMQPDQVKYTDTNTTKKELKVLVKEPGFFEQFGNWIKWSLIILGSVVIIFFVLKFVKK